MFGIRGTFFTFVAGIAAACIIGYCVYFDYQRCTAVDYKRKVRERRRKQTNSNVPKGDSNEEQLQRIFVSELQMGDTAISRGDIYKGIDHFVNATLISGRPAPMIQLFQSRLPPQIFELYIHRMQDVRNKIISEDYDNSENTSGRRPLILFPTNE